MEEENTESGESFYSEEIDSAEGEEEEKPLGRRKSYSEKEIEKILKDISESDSGKNGGKDLSHEIIKFSSKKSPFEKAKPTSFKSLPKVSANAAQNNNKNQPKEEKIIFGAIITISAAILVLIGVLAYVLLS